ncbi:MAG: GNAT family N-acetyltransferase [Nitrososphaeria archaeon]
MKIYNLEKNSLDQLKPLIVQCNFIPFNEHGITKDLIANYVINALSDIISEGGFVWVAEENYEITGFISTERSHWDSKHFGLEIAKINHIIASKENPESFRIKQNLISHLFRKYQADGIFNIHSRIYKEDLSSIHALESCNFRLMDVLVTYFFDLRQNARISNGVLCRVREFQQDEIHKLVKIVRRSFGNFPIAMDRFHADPTLPKEKSTEIYVKWLITSSHALNSTILVAEVDGEPIGLNVCTINGELAEKLGIRIGNIALVAVDPAFRERYVATSLINAALNWFVDKADIVEIGVQVSNYKLQRVLCRLGFKIIRSQCTFHWSPEFERYNT